MDAKAVQRDTLATQAMVWSRPMSFKPRQHSRRWMLKAGLIAVTCAGVVMATMARPIYKHVDEQGNVSYSDSPQSQDARPMELPPINTQISETAGAGDTLTVHCAMK